MGSSSDGAGIRLCVGSSEVRGVEDPFDIRCFLNCINFLSYTFKTFILQHKLHPLILQTSEHVLKKGIAPFRLLACLFSQLA